MNTLVSAGYRPLTAMVLAARNINSASAAHSYLSCNAPLADPYRMKDMQRAVARINTALVQGETVAVFGDYDVDGITATCLLTDYLRSQGAHCIPYIPGRLEEGYGLNPIAIRQLHQTGVRLIITVDCGITAVEEAALCRELGIDLVITDHHECKQQLPDAIAVVDPHRNDDTYPHQNLSGVGVAFKLAAALCGDQEEILQRYADMVCLGTVADVMLLQGENRVFVDRGLQSLRSTHRPGLAALIKECGCDPDSLNAASIGYMLAPRINAAGRMGQIDLAIELFLTQDHQHAQALASGLCELNRQRQSVESEIYEQAIAMLPQGSTPDAIVLADSRWHQGVVGIVASRIAEEYCCPTFLICLDGDHGKASSRSYGGFNLFSALTQLSGLLESYGGHELAAGFTISRQNIDAFRQEICRLAKNFYNDDTPRTVLDIDCAVSPELLTLPNVASLSTLEPTGNGCPKPLLILENMTVDRLRPVGNGRHLRMRLLRGNYALNAICFSATSQTVSVAQGELVDVAFIPQINIFRDERTVQLNIADIRPACKADCPSDLGNYRALRSGCLTPDAAHALYPDRSTLTLVWKYLEGIPGPIHETPMCLCRKIVRWSDTSLSLEQFMTCLDIFSDVGLIQIQRLHKYISIRLTHRAGKADLSQSPTMQTLLNAKES